MTPRDAQEIKQLLMEIEFVYMDEGTPSPAFHCPVCLYGKDLGHKKGCNLARALALLRKPTCKGKKWVEASPNTTKLIRCPGCPDCQPKPEEPRESNDLT